MDIKELVKTEIENSVKAQETIPEPQEVALESVKESNLESIAEPVVETLETPEVEALQQSVAQEKEDEIPINENENETETIPEVESLDLEPPEYSEQEDFGGLDLDLDIDLSTEVDLGGAPEPEPEYEAEPVQESNIESFIEEPSVKSLNLNESHSVLSGENVPIDEQNTEVKTILLDTKNSLSDEDIEKKRNLKNKKAFNFFNDSVEEADSE